MNTIEAILLLLIFHFCLTGQSSLINPTLASFPKNDLLGTVRAGLLTGWQWQPFLIPNKQHHKALRY